MPTDIGYTLAGCWIIGCVLLILLAPLASRKSKR
jgi:hypothetical protein